MPARGRNKRAEMIWGETRTGRGRRRSYESRADSDRSPSPALRVARLVVAKPSGCRASEESRGERVNIVIRAMTRIGGLKSREKRQEDEAERAVSRRPP